jgi:LysR family nod box-dependent transcriptional activator
MLGGAVNFIGRGQIAAPAKVLPGEGGVRFKGLDLNLIVALDALLTTRSVSRAAELTCISQPAMSAALARLRDYFDDQLLITGTGLATLSPLGESLRLPAARALGYISDHLVSSGSFDPETSDREFRILAADTVIQGLLAAALQRIAPLAPKLRYSLLTPNGVSLDKLESGQLDLLIVPERVASPSHPAELLFEEKHTVIACAQCWTSDTLSLEEFRTADHVEVFIGGLPYLPSVLGVPEFDRHIAVRLDQFALVPSFVSGSRRLATFPGMTAEIFSHSAQLRYFRPPFPIPPVRLAMQWHSRANADVGLQWLRRELRASITQNRSHKRRLYRVVNQSI